MIQLGTVLNVCDKTGVVLSKCIKVLGPGKNKLALLGDVVLVSIKRFNSKHDSIMKKKKYFKGRMHRALFLRARKNFMRSSGLFVKFDENSVIIVNKNRIPLSNRVFGPIVREFCLRWPSLGCITRYMM